MKKLDSLLIKMFLPPFFMAFGIVMFVFTMQTMWKFIDDIIGKGAGIAMILEFIFYLSLSLVPMSLPAAILLASIMLMGNLAERYELTAMKSAGISLWRIMYPLIGIGILISTASFFINNNVVPVANLKFKTRLYNFKTKKLSLSLEQGVFNDDFRNFSIRINKKHENGDLEDIMMYDHSAQHRNRTKIIYAEEGRMDMESDERFLIMDLKNGRQYQELEEEKGWKKTDPRKYPYLRLEFGELEKYLDLKEFDMKEVNEEIFKEDDRMLSCRQLLWQLDTMKYQMGKRRENVTDLTLLSFYFVKTNSDSSSTYVPLSEAGSRLLDASSYKKKTDITNPKGARGMMKSNKELPSNLVPPGKPNTTPKPKKPNNKSKKNNYKPPPSKPSTAFKTEGSLYYNDENFKGEPNAFQHVFKDAHYKQMVSYAISNISSIDSRFNDYGNRLRAMNKRKGKYLYQIHLKFSLAMACMVFLFIGAPLGAIVRKGGFGVPVLFGTTFFVAFVALVTVFKKLAEGGTLTSEMAAWGPVFIFTIPCIFLTRGAIRDAKAMNLDLISNTIKGWVSGGRKKKKQKSNPTD